MNTELKILYLENESSVDNLVGVLLKKRNIYFEKENVSTLIAFENALNDFKPTVILADLENLSLDVYELLKLLKRERSTSPLIFVVDNISDEFAEDILFAGVDDYVFKDCLLRLPQAIFNAIAKKNVELKLHESERLNNDLLSSIHLQLAVLDLKGNLLTINKAWIDFTQKKGINSFHCAEVGDNFFNCCNDAIKKGDNYAVKGLDGIQSVINKEKDYFEMEYPSIFLEEQQWFIFSVKNFGIDTNKIIISLQEITQRKIAENKQRDTSVELQKTLFELNNILDSSLDVICTINVKGEFVYVNPSSLKVWGYKPEELIGNNFMNLVHDEDADATTKLAEKITSGFPSAMFENRYVHKNGKIVPLLWSANWDEKRQLVFCIAKDVTEHKRLEHSIENKRDQFYDMLVKAPSAIGMLKGSDHIYEMANPLYLQMIGKKNIIGKSVSEVLPEIIDQGYISILDHVYQTGESYSGTETLVKLNANNNDEIIDFYLNFAFQPYRNGNGEIEGIFFFINDITEQIISRNKLEKSEKQYRQIVETAQEGIMQLDENSRIIFVNKKICEILGYTERELIGREHFNFMDAYEKENVLIAFERRKKGISEKYPITFLTKKGKEVLTNVSVNPIFDEQSNFKGSLGMISDITEKKKADEEIKFKANLLNTIGQAVIATDLNGIVNYWNKAAKNIYGWTKEEALGKPIANLVETENNAMEVSQIIAALKKGQTWSGESMMQKKDGIPFPALITHSPIYNENNELSGVIGIYSDITEIKKLERLLEKTNRLAAIGSWEIDVLKGTVYWSDITKEIREVDKDFIPKLDIGISYFKEGIDKETISKKVQECIEKGTPWDEELQIITFKGNYKWVRTIGEGEFLNGKCIRIHGSFQDISDRKKIAEDLRISQSNLQAVIENTDAAIYSIDTKFRYIAFNKSLYNSVKQNFGLEIKIGDNTYTFLEKLDPHEAKKWKKIYAKAFKGKTVKFENEFTTDGVYKCYSFTINPIWTNKTIIGLSCFAQDITIQKEEQKQKEKMIYDIIQHNRDLEQFSYIVSHNLRAPTANIMGFTEILQEEILTQDEQKELLQGLSASVLGLDSIIKDINIILQSQREVHKKKEVIVFSKLVEDIVVSIGNLIDKKTMHIQTDFSEVNEIYSLKVYIYSIFYNLISNSVKYSKPNQKQFIEVKSKNENGKTVITFNDNGLGFDINSKGDKIFGLYNRFHSHVEGKGMGLFMVKTQVESLGGKISVESELNKGTKFTIVF
ncbi:PAS domain S-box protein [uncultured Flavobacterium sp.]|uniref:PAS domain S-box protein n=1 Tax=uncultured Flavobacterium sp. TaxID=165435 RepID=UPI0030EB5421